MNILSAIPRAGWGLAAMLALGLAGCGGGGGGGGAVTPAALAPGVAGAAVNAAAAIPTNDTSANSSAGFSVLQNAGLPVATLASPLKINFTVFSDGGVKTGLTTSNVSVVIAKLVPGSAGNPDQWVNYIYRTESTAAAPNNGGNVAGAPALASALQATSDPKDKQDPAYPADPTKKLGTLVYNAAEGYYTYTFSTDIRNPAFNANSVKTNGVVFEPSRTHRVALQLSYTNAAGKTVRANPYYDFKFVADGAGYKAVALSNPATETRLMADITNCNTCHNQLALHGGGRVDVQYCVMCHNPGTVDANSGNVLTMSTMVHKIHAGRRLGASALQIWGYGGAKHDYTEVGFPQDLRNCNKCHTQSAATPNGDNWKNKPTKEACLTCHLSGAGSAWRTSHDTLATTIHLANADAMTNLNCAGCHADGSNLSANQVHWNQGEENAAKYKVNIESATYNPATRKVTVAYNVADPTNNNALYNLTADCGGITCTSNSRFGNLRFYVAYKNLVGASNALTEWSSYNNGGSGANVYPARDATAVNLGGNHYSIDIAVPADTATAVAQGTARVITIGQVKEQELDVILRTPIAGPVLMNVSMQHTYKDVALDGAALAPRREIVSDAYCNNCHGTLGTTSGSNTLSTAFHSGARNSVIACALCHDPLRMSSTVMADGSGFQESYQFKRMIHGIHGGAKRTFPFTHGNTNKGPWNKNGTLVSDGVTTFAAGVENYTHEVAYPGILSDCTTCHLTNSVTGQGTFENDVGPFGAVISKKDTDPFTGTTTTDPLLWKVISPKAASCTACHDSANARNHVSDWGGLGGGGVFGTAVGAVAATQGNMLNGAVAERCNQCHGPNGPYAVKNVHSGLANPTNNP